MSSLLPKVALIAVLVAAFALRWAPNRERRLEGEIPGASWLVDDERSAAHLRTIECALAGAGDAREDRYLGHPAGTLLPWSPPFESVLAAVAQRVLPHDRGEEALRGIDEAHLFDFVLRAPLVLGLLAVVLALWALRPVLQSVGSRWLALGAAAFVAVAPASVATSSVGQLDILAWLVLLLLLSTGLVVRALRAEDSLAAILGALLSAAACGAFLASSPLGLIGYAAAWSGFLTWALSADPERAALGQRAGIAFTAASAFLARTLGTGGDPDALARGALAGWNESASTLALLGVVPFLAILLWRAQRAPRPLQIFIQIGALGVLVWISPAAFSGLRQGFAWYFERRADLALFVPGHASLFGGGAPWTALIGATPLVLSAPGVLWMLLRGEREPVHVFLGTLLVLTLAAACVEVRLFALVVPVLAIALAVAADEWLEEHGLRLQRRAQLVGGVIALLFLAHFLAALFTPIDLVRREERIELTRGLRWMREHTSSPGPWNAPLVQGEWAVLSTPSIGATIALEARRPVLASGIAITGQLAELRAAAEALLTTDAAALVRFAHANEVRYVVAGPRLLNELAALARVSPDPELEALRLPGARGPARSMPASESTILWQLACAPLELKGELVPGFERVYASPRLVDSAGRAAPHAPAQGEPFGPAISIWKLVGPPPPPATPRLEAR